MKPTSDWESLPVNETIRFMSLLAQQTDTWSSRFSTALHLALLLIATLVLYAGTLTPGSKTELLPYASSVAIRSRVGTPQSRRSSITMGQSGAPKHPQENETARQVDEPTSGSAFKSLRTVFRSNQTRVSGLVLPPEQDVTHI